MSEHPELPTTTLSSSFPTSGGHGHLMLCFGSCELPIHDCLEARQQERDAIRVAIGDAPFFPGSGPTVTTTQHTVGSVQRYRDHVLALLDPRDREAGRP